MGYTAHAFFALVKITISIMRETPNTQLNIANNKEENRMKITVLKQKDLQALLGNEREVSREEVKKFDEKLEKIIEKDLMRPFRKKLVKVLKEANFEDPMAISYEKFYGDLYSGIGKGMDNLMHDEKFEELICEYL